MKNVFIINAHEPYPFSEGKLNRSMMEKARTNLKAKGYEVRLTTMQDDYDVETEIDNHRWADAVIVQTPCNWMGVPWTFKKYMDMVYSAGMDGRLCDGDGRTRRDPSRQYGSGGALAGKNYMLSITYNAPNRFHRRFELHKLSRRLLVAAAAAIGPRSALWLRDTEASC